jgi:hypothetical protein
MPAKPISYYLSPALLLLSTALAAGNWYLRPERAFGWATALIVVGCMTVAFLLVPRLSPGAPAVAGAARPPAGASVTSGIVFGGLVLVISLSIKLATALGAPSHDNLAKRATMAIIGAFLVFTGNSIPKTLACLPAREAEAARVQSFQRFAGWAWVLTGLAFALAWLVLPADLAETITFTLLPASIFIILVQCIRVRRARGIAA